MASTRGHTGINRGWPCLNACRELVGRGTHITRYHRGAWPKSGSTEPEALESSVENKNTPHSSSLCISTSAPRILCGKHLFQVAPLKALGSWQRRDLVLLILHPQGLAQNLAQSRCSINVCWMRKLLAGRAVSCHSRESDQRKQRLEVCTVRPMSRIQECGIRWELSA